MPYLLTNNNLWFCFCMQKSKRDAEKFSQTQTHGDITAAAVALCCRWWWWWCQSQTSTQLVHSLGKCSGSNTAVKWYDDMGTVHASHHHHCRSVVFGRVNVLGLLLDIFYIQNLPYICRKKYRSCLYAFFLKKKVEVDNFYIYIFFFRDTKHAQAHAQKEKSNSDASIHRQTSSFEPKMAKKFLIHLNDLWNEVQNKIKVCAHIHIHTCSGTWITDRFVGCFGWNAFCSDYVSNESPLK